MATAQPQKKVEELEVLQEDDEFEEFEGDWQDNEEEEEGNLWEADWDDEDVNDEFSKQLRAELEKSGLKPMDTN